MTSIHATKEKVLQKEVDRLKTLCEKQVLIIAEDLRANTNLREKLEASQKRVTELEVSQERARSEVSETVTGEGLPGEQI